MAQEKKTTEKKPDIFHGKKVEKKQTRKQVSVKHQNPEDWKTPEAVEKIHTWIRNGLTMAEIASNIGIGTGTLYKWINDDEVFLNTFKEGRRQCTDIVENALFKHCVEDRDSKAIIFWLKNRKSCDWKDRIEAENINHNEETIVLEIR